MRRSSRHVALLLVGVLLGAVLLAALGPATGPGPQHQATTTMGGGR